MILVSRGIGMDAGLRAKGFRRPWQAPQPLMRIAEAMNPQILAPPSRRKPLAARIRCSCLPPSKCQITRMELMAQTPAPSSNSARQSPLRRFSTLSRCNDRGIVRVGDFPRSMLDVAGAAWAFDNVPPRRILPSARSGVENAPAERLGPPNEVEGLGGIVNNSEAKIDWAKGIKDQGDDFENYYGKENPQARRLLPGATAFDYFDDATGDAV